MDNRSRLLGVALDLLTKRGYDGVGVQEIVDTAEITKPTLYHYFTNKRGLLDALIAHEAGRMMNSFRNAAIYQGDLILTLENITRVCFSHAKQFSNFYRMQLTMYYSPPESEPNQAIQPFVRDQQSILENVFIQASNNHGNMHGRHRRYAAGFLGAINAMVGLYLNGELKLTEELIHLTVHQFLHGILS
jgi:TetR/AcrR family transcriptional regulator